MTKPIEDAALLDAAVAIVKSDVAPDLKRELLENIGVIDPAPRVEQLTLGIDTNTINETTFAEVKKKRAPKQFEHEIVVDGVEYISTDKAAEMLNYSRNSVQSLARENPEKYGLKQNAKACRMWLERSKVVSVAYDKTVGGIK